MQPLSSTFPPSGRRPSPGVAFWISLVIPGGGEIYCGKRIRGVSTLCFTAVALAGVMLLPPASYWWEASLRTLAALYIFSFIDAYYTAVEINQGKEPGPYQNPRVAAVLNLLTYGFGYFYLGERGKGLAVFLGLRLVAAPLGRAPWLMDLLLFAIAADAYRIGSREFLRPKSTPMLASSGLLLLGLADDARPPATPTAEPMASPPAPVPGALPQFVPLTLAVILGLAYGTIIATTAILPDYQVLDQSRAEFSRTVEEKIYSNPRYGITMHIPAQWVFAGLGGGYLVQAASPDGVCRAGLVLDSISPFRKLESRKDVILAEIQGINPDARLVGQRESKLGVRSGYELTFSHMEGGYEILTRFVLVQKGMTLYSLILTNPAPFDEDCRRLTDVIRLRLVLPED